MQSTVRSISTPLYAVVNGQQEGDRTDQMIEEERGEGRGETFSPFI